MLPGKRDYTNLTTKTCQHWQQQAGGCQIILLPRRCYQQIGWLLQCHYLTYQICLEKFHELIPKVCNKSFSLANHGHIWVSCTKFLPCPLGNKFFAILYKIIRKLPLSTCFTNLIAGAPFL